VSDLASTGKPNLDSDRLNGAGNVDGNQEDAA
jgi:hypothetical protein